MQPFSCSCAVIALLFAVACVARADSATAPDRAGEGRFDIGPDYKDAPEIKYKEGVPKGEIKQFTMNSEDSKIYPGIKGGKPGFPYKRKVGVYIPAGYKEGTPLPFMVIQDGMNEGFFYYLKMMPPTLDNLIAEKRIPAMAAIFIDSGGGDSKGSERGLEYDTVSGAYSDFIETEVLPVIAKDYKLTFTTDPEGRATMGGSSGAACAFTMAWFHPERYRRVLSYSGTYVNQQSPVNPESPHGAWEYHENWIAKADAKPIRIWMHVSDGDIGHGSGEKNMHDWPLANDRMYDVLKAKGYHVTYYYAKGAGHCDPKVTAQTLPAAIEWLWKTYTPK